MERLQVGIAGGAGYTGGELLRILLGHPQVDVAAVSSSTYPGQPLHAAHPNLRGRPAPAFTAELNLDRLDAVFVAGGHGEAMAHVPRWLAHRSDIKIIDLSGDFRLRDAGLYPRWYGREHTAPDLLPSFVYGLTEWYRSEIARATRIANPGCFATAIELALGPLARAGVVGAARVTAVTGSSGSGAKPSATTHHPTRAANVRAYKPLQHQHTPEIEQMLDTLAGAASLRVALVPVSGPLVRGIYAVCHVDLPVGWTDAHVRSLVQTAYQGSRFVHFVEEPPELAAVTGSNNAQVYVAIHDGQIAACCAIDNLVKGAAGQAVQNLNVMVGWPEQTGLDFAGQYP